MHVSFLGGGVIFCPFCASYSRYTLTHGRRASTLVTTFVLTSHTSHNIIISHTTILPQWYCTFFFFAQSNNKTVISATPCRFEFSETESMQANILPINKSSRFGAAGCAPCLRVVVPTTTMSLSPTCP
jgi:hypothetical protein